MLVPTLDPPKTRPSAVGFLSFGQRERGLYLSLLENEDDIYDLGYSVRLGLADL